MIKAHEVARFKYTNYLADLVPKAFDESHFKLSVDPMRVMSMPESLNGLTGVSRARSATDVHRCAYAFF